MHRDNSIEWKQIGEERFNRVVEALLTRMYHHPPASTVEVIDGRGGDDGIDVAVSINGKLNRIFQLKHFPEGFSGGFRKSRRAQIKKSFDRAWDNHRPPRWTLVFPGNPTVDEGKYVTKLGDGRAVTPTVWGQARLDSELAKHSDLLAWATRDGLVETLMKFGQEKAALSSPDDLVDRARSLHDLANTVSPFWATDFGVSEHGVTRVFRAKDPRAAELEPLGFKMNIETQDLGLGKSIQRILDYGARRGVTIPGTAVSSFATIGPDWFTGPDGLDQAGDVHLIEISADESSQVDEQILVTLEFLDEEGFTKASHKGHLTRKSNGRKGIGFTALFYGTIELDAEIPFNMAESGKFHIGLTLENASVRDAKQALRVRDDLRSGAVLQILFQGKRLLRVAAEQRPLGLVDAATELLIDDLAVLEDKLNAAFIVPPSLTARERVMIRVARHLVEGHSTWMPPQTSLTLEVVDDPPEGLVDNLDDARAILMQTPSMPIEIQGSKFNLGPTALYHPRAAPRDVGEIRKALAEGVARGKLVIFDPLGEQLVRVMPMSETTTSPQHVPWDLPDIPVPGLEVQKLDDVELIKD